MDLEKLRRMNLGDVADEIVRLRAELDVTTRLLAERHQVRNATPEREQHGKCAPQAIEWTDRTTSPPRTVVRYVYPQLVPDGGSAC